MFAAPGRGGGLPARVIGPDALGREVRGKGTNTRYVTNILPEGEPADSLLVVGAAVIFLHAFVAPATSKPGQKGTGSEKGTGTFCSEDSAK